MSGNFHVGDSINVSGNNNVGKMVGRPGASAESMWEMPHRTSQDRSWREPILFMNYRNPDEKAAADLDTELTHRLGPGAVFRDARMLAGTEFPRELAERARRCKVMVAIIGERWDDANGLRLLHSNSDWVRREIATALAHGVHVVPVMVGARGRLVPGGLPEDIRRIAYLQAPHLRRGYDPHDVRRLVEELMRDLAVPMEAVFRGR
jgi:hypothetical protein